MSENPIIVFVCEHGAAKSVVAATYFNHFAKQRGQHLRAVARGINPDRELSEQTIKGLAKDELTPSEPMPQQFAWNDLESAQRIVSFCELPKEYKEKLTTEQWDGVPPVSENYDMARDAIIHRLNYLIDDLRSSS